MALVDDLKECKLYAILSVVGVIFVIGGVGCFFGGFVSTNILTKGIPGIGIGCIAIGAFILIFCCYLRRKDQYSNVNTGPQVTTYSATGTVVGTQQVYPQGAPTYPAQQGSHPPQQGSYPPQHGNYPPQQGNYPPPQQGVYQQQGTYPPSQNTYPPSPNTYPPPQGTYPPPQGSYIPPQGTYPQATYPAPESKSSGSAYPTKPDALPEVAPPPYAPPSYDSTATAPSAPPS
ncbi:annexin A7-like [Hydractinia symbiolongicarpus]|uniref:annexin A7-like n=1 Tax=Hydractinia symbiolongicarpus TaxID=13093 RepID=UPI002549FD6B|nr:annexin A7-like [Hydractinia symbiolongicarpus]